MSEINFKTVDDIRRHSGWREEEEERIARRLERQDRELAETEKKRQHAREAREQKQALANSDAWYAAVDGRFHEHLKSWLWGAIDDRIHQHLDRYGEIFKDAVGAALGTIRKQVCDEFKCADEQLQRAFEAKLAVVEERLASNDRILIETTGGPQGQARLREELKRALEETVNACGQEIAALEERLRAVPGKLPAAKTYCPDTVHYAGHVVVHQGATYQALRDTARAPPHVDDWVCIASAGADGQSVTVRGAFTAHKKYMRFDVIEHDGSSFVAIRDNPGIPGDDGWQLVSRSGRRGPAGETGPRGGRGERGARGEDGREIVSWHLEPGTYRAFPTYADGKLGPELNLRPLFEQFVAETGHAAE